MTFTHTTCSTLRLAALICGLSALTTTGPGCVAEEGDPAGVGPGGGKADEDSRLASFITTHSASKLIEVGRLTKNSATDPGWEILRSLDVPADAVTLSSSTEGDVDGAGETTTTFRVDGAGLGYWVWSYRQGARVDELRYLLLDAAGQDVMAGEDVRDWCRDHRVTDEYCVGARAIADEYAGGREPTEARKRELLHAGLKAVRLDSGELLVWAFGSAIIEDREGNLAFWSVRVVRDGLRP